VAQVIRRITIAALAAALAGAVLVLPAAAQSGPQAVAAKKAKKCKKGKKAKKKKKGCKKGATGGPSGGGLPGQATPSSPTPPEKPNTPTLEVASLDVAASHVFGGNTTTGEVTLDANAPAGGQVVDLQSNNKPRASVPDTVIVPSGQKTAGFTVSTTAGPVVTATLTASIGGSQDTAQVSVVDTASVASVRLERHCLSTETGTYPSNRVTLDIPAEQDTAVTLSDNPSGFLTLPPTVTVPQGSTTAFFSLDATAEAPAVTVTATLGASSAHDTASVNATQVEPKAADLTVDPNVIDVGTSSTSGTITLDCEALSDTTVQLSSDDPRVVVPSTPVSIPEGHISLTFSIGTSAAPVGDYTIHATVGGVTKDAPLTVTNLGT
jgi:hypothetical protein